MKDDKIELTLKIVIDNEYKDTSIHVNGENVRSCTFLNGNDVLKVIMGELQFHTDTEKGYKHLDAQQQFFNDAIFNLNKISFDAINLYR